MNGHYITYGSKKSSDPGFIIESVDYGQAKARTIYESIPYRNGALNLSTASGKAYFDRRSITYRFVRRADSTEEINSAVSELILFLKTISRSRVYDSFLSAYLQEPQFEYAERTYLDMKCTAARVTAVISADPYFVSAATGDEFL